MRLARQAIARLRGDERGTETIVALFVLPILFILALGIIDIGFMMKTRMSVESIARDAVRAAAVDGGNYTRATAAEQGRPWDAAALAALYRNGSCTQSPCKHAPSVDCQTITSPTGSVYRSNQVNRAGDLITCTVQYPYKPITGGILSTPMGLGLGALVDRPFTITVTARADTQWNR
jgi:Flp pilus assembly protein TadG